MGEPCDGGDPSSRSEWRDFMLDECPHDEWGPVVTVSGMGDPIDYRVCTRCKRIAPAWAAYPRDVE